MTHLGLGIQLTARLSYTPATVDWFCKRPHCRYVNSNCFQLMLYLIALKIWKFFRFFFVSSRKPVLTFCDYIVLEYVPVLTFGRML